MKTVLVCNQKGGVGKTLIADELAFALERDKIRFNFYDLDGQGSSIHQTREDPEAVISIVIPQDLCRQICLNGLRKQILLSFLQ